MRASLSLTGAVLTGGRAYPAEAWGLLFAVALPPAGARVIAPLISTEAVVAVADRPLVIAPGGTKPRSRGEAETEEPATATIEIDRHRVVALGGWCVGVVAVAMPVARRGPRPSSAARSSRDPIPAVADLANRLGTILSATVADVAPARADRDLPTGLARPPERPPPESVLARLAAGPLEPALDELGRTDSVHRAEALQALRRFAPPPTLVLGSGVSGSTPTGAASIIARRSGAGPAVGLPRRTRRRRRQDGRRRSRTAPGGRAVPTERVGTVGTGLTAVLVWPTAEIQRFDVALPLRDGDGEVVGRVGGDFQVVAIDERSGP